MVALTPTRATDATRRARIRFIATRVLIVVNFALALNYITWRYLFSINWAFWPVALLLLAAETYSFLDGSLFGLTIWGARPRPRPDPPAAGLTVDVFVTCYNEATDLVRETIQAAVAISYPHQTFVLDDGNSPSMAAMAAAEGVGYVVRSVDWQNRSRHAKAGNVNNALFQTDGEFILILDADQIPRPEILDRVLGYFVDPLVAFVQTPQWFYNLPEGNPFGSDAALFYGPIMQGKDGWNAAFFCGSNAVLRRDALLQLGITKYAHELPRRVKHALDISERVLRNAARQIDPTVEPRVRAAIDQLRQLVRTTRADLRRHQPIQDVTWQFQRRVEELSRGVIREDLAQIRADLQGLLGDELANIVDSVDVTLADEHTVSALTGRANSPLAAIAVVRELMLGIDVDRDNEAQPLLPLATISVTEDMATAMELHRLKWRSVYHHEILARGLAPEDLRTSLQQRLRWAQGTIQVFLRENPLLVPGLKLPQRLMYLGTMWSYLSGFFTAIYLLAPVLYLTLGWLPVRAYGPDFFAHLIPFLVVNQIVFIVVGWGLPTWRGQQYSVALFPLWIEAVVTAVLNVYFGRPLGFVVTPKTRQSGVYLELIRFQLLMVALLVSACLYGTARLALGLTNDWLPIAINVAWSIYDLIALSVVVKAVVYRPRPAAASVAAVTGT